MDRAGRRHGPEMLDVGRVRGRIAEAPVLPPGGEVSTRANLVVFAKGENSWSAYAPNVPGRVAAAEPREATETLFREALKTRLEMMRKQGKPVPEPLSQAVLIWAAA